MYVYDLELFGSDLECSNNLRDLTAAQLRTKFTMEFGMRPLSNVH